MLTGVLLRGRRLAILLLIFHGLNPFALVKIGRENTICQRPFAQDARGTGRAEPAKCVRPLWLAASRSPSPRPSPSHGIHLIKPCFPADSNLLDTPFDHPPSPHP